MKRFFSDLGRKYIGIIPLWALLLTKSPRKTMKTILITGASRGIGKATAFLMASEGYNLVLCARNLDALKSVKKQILQENEGCEVHLFDFDIADKLAILNLGIQLAEKNLTIDVLINNAGNFLPGKISEEADDVFETMIFTNLASVYHMSRLVLPKMKEMNAGYILNICSTASIVPYINGGSYCISKFGELGLTKVLREELKETGIKVTAILPGATLTDSWNGTDLPEERFMNAESVAKVILQCIQSPFDIVHEEILIRPQKGDI